VKYVLEAYGPDSTKLLDGADGFLMQTLGEYAGPAAQAIETRWQQNQIAKLPTLLLNTNSLAAFISALRDFLADVFSVENAEVLIAAHEQADNAEASTTKLWGLQSEDDDLPLLTRQPSHGVKLMQKDERRWYSLLQKGIVATVARQTSQQNAVVTYVCPRTDRDKTYKREMDGYGVFNSLTASVVKSDDRRASGELALSAVISMRNRKWTDEGKLSAENVEKMASFTSSDLDLLEQLNPHIDQAIKSALQAEESRKSLYTANRFERQAEAIMTITGCVAQGKGLNDLFIIVVREITQLLHCDRATMFLLTDDRKKLYSLVEPYPPHGDHKIRIEVPISEKSIVGSSVLHKAITNLPNAYDDERFNRKTDQSTGYITRSLLSIPIIDKRTKEVIGAMQCLNKLDSQECPVGQSFTNEDVDLCHAFSAVVCVALMSRTDRDVAECPVLSHKGLG